MNRYRKLEILKEILRETESALIAYSGGVDSTFLLKIARDTLGSDVLAVTADSPTYPSQEIQEAKALARKLSVRHLTIETEEFADSNFISNPPDRCYYCKKELFSKLRKIARENHLNHILDGSNLDDEKDFRPGMRAAREFGVRSPLREAGFTKEDIRQLSKELDLATWNKPALACLASRFPYGKPLTKQDLGRVGKAEKLLRDMGIGQIRVRHHGHIARIEVPRGEINRFLSDSFRKKLVDKLKELGYTYVTLDLEGYRTGSMNEVLPHLSPSARKSMIK
ncbi:ATP-dependent sacrificial sulfur transferase LarE [Candidatus Aerophobetes bacterium]|uniref:ATP-dependent sacrificial sulfur transferase LarE n=1 Tax=Aerophobetes bacterium TaxID=2030807 RepID=A0A523T9K5_UNCAE|nr:MAG: ATP-dependent sacrificial sulfur transferase LarE [Candidatus Aerophobetes bacterium]